jgi:hypothetical protein
MDGSWMDWQGQVFRRNAARCSPGVHRAVQLGNDEVDRLRLAPTFRVRRAH